MIGRTIGHYRIVARIGAGGMGEVFEAEDTRLLRRVALKLLPPDLASDPERLSRFEAEARAVAALSHPNIVTLHSIEHAEGLHFLTLERVEGRALSAGIPPAGMAIRSLLELGAQIADAVAAAHLRGITHRDLKPDNVMVTPDGRAKVLDFGLAKLHEAPHTTSSVLATVVHQTREGAILGTVHYMAPEQAEGRPADARSDVFSLGVLLYEMATGRRPFDGESAASTIAAILRDTPPSPIELNHSVPRDLARIIRICLAKEPLRRYQTAVDLRNELEDLRRQMDSGELGALASTGAGPVAAGARPRLPLVAIVAIGALLGGGLGGLWLGGAGRATPTTAPTHVEQFTDREGVETDPSLSPDGRSVAYAALDGDHGDILVQRVGGRNATHLTRTPGVDEGAPRFSPDGQRIAFHLGDAPGGICVIGATGESQRRLTDFGFHPAWSPDGREIAFCSERILTPKGRGSTSALWVVNVESGQTRKIHDGDAVQPAWSPDGRRIAFWGVPGGSGQRDVFTIPAAGGPVTAVTQDAVLDWSPAWSPDGRALYFASERGGSMSLWRIPVNGAGGAAGPPVPVTTQTGASTTGIALAAGGRRAAFTSAVQRSNLVRITLDPARTRVTGFEQITNGTQDFRSPDLSPDGQWITLVNYGVAENILVCRADGTELRWVTDDVHRDRLPRWSPDGTRIAFYSNRTGSYNMWSARSDGGDLKPMTEAAEGDLMWGIWSPDGTRMCAVRWTARKSYLFDPRRTWAGQVPESLPATTVGDRHLVPTAWSRDGARIGGPMLGLDGGYNGVGVYELATRAMRVFEAPATIPSSSRALYGQWLEDHRTWMTVVADRVLLLDTGTGGWREIPFDRKYDFTPASFTCSPDGRTIYTTLAETEADIWLMEWK